MKKQETFKVMALGEALSLPILLIGEPGVAKTAAVMDFAKARLGASMKDEDVFILETDEGTKSTAVKGNMDLKELALNSEFKINSPISRASVVVINEIDKSSGGLRNSFLSIMNEKMLFNGSEKVPTNWKSFIATCNSIPDDEKDSPFWDRFLITFRVGRLSQTDMLKYYSKGGKKHSQSHKINIPEDADIDGINLNPEKLKKTISAVYDKLSDRALTFLPRMVKAVSFVWGISEDKAFIKAVELLTDKPTAKALAKELVPAEVRRVYDLIDKIGMSSSHQAYNDAYDELLEAYSRAKSNVDSNGNHRAPLMTDADDEGIKNKINEQEKKLAFLSQEDEDENGVELT